MTEYRVLYNGILSGIWKGGEKGTIILAPGLPQFIDKYHPLVKAIEELEFTLITPRYIGTWESDGTFSLDNAIQTIEKTVDLGFTGKTRELLDEKEITWNRERIYLMGFGFGALPTLFVDRKNMKKILVCPFISSKFHSGGKGDPIEVTYNYLERAYPNLYRLNSDKLLKELLDLDLPIEQDDLVVAVGRKDTIIPQDEIASIRGLYNVRMHWLEIEHSIALTAAQLITLL